MPSFSAPKSSVSQTVVWEQTIACLQARLSRYQSVPLELKVQLQPHLDQWSALHHKLSQPLVQIAVFGLVSRGKSAILNALFGEPLFPTGPLNGVTQWPRSVRWSPPDSPAGTLQIELIDTPGLAEIEGSARASMAQEIAHHADVILFVTAGPPMAIEQAAIVDLLHYAKPLLWVVNKADLHPQLCAADLYQALPAAAQQGLSPREIVLTAAAPLPIQVRHEWPDGRTSTAWETPPPRIEPLQQALADLLDREGLLLLCLNGLLQAQTIERQMVDAIAQFYAQSVQIQQWQLGGIKALVVGLMPWPGWDILLGFGLDLAQVRQLTKRYHLAITAHKVRDLWQRLGISAACVGIGDLLTSGLGTLWEPGSSGSPLVGSIMQGVIAVYSATLVSRGAQRYLLEGATWEPQGSSRLLQTLLGTLQPDWVVSRFQDALTATLTEPERPALVQSGEERPDRLG